MNEDTRKDAFIVVVGHKLDSVYHRFFQLPFHAEWVNKILNISFYHDLRIPSFHQTLTEAQCGRFNLCNQLCVYDDHQHLL